jgi:hypothetical protein
VSEHIDQLSQQLSMPGCQSAETRAAENIRDESRVEDHAWTGLASAWAGKRPEDPPANVVSEWAGGHVLEAPTLSGIDNGRVLGRVTVLARFRDFLVQNYPDEFTPDLAIEFLEGLLQEPLQRQRSLLRRFLLGGRFFFWATFDPGDPNRSPFTNQMKQQRSVLMSELGLERLDADYVHVRFEYKLEFSQVDPQDRVISSLIADKPTARIPACPDAYAGAPARWNPHFRVAADASQSGYTETWTGGQGRPEVVHEPINGSALHQSLSLT